jgi:lauroyl/myristoyl acyltransferase
LDISKRFDGVEVHLFGCRAAATPASALLVIQCKNPIIAACSHRNAKGRLVIHIMPPVEIQRTNDLRTDLQFNTQPITSHVEQAVRNYPEQWNWMPKRWKNFYPDLYPESKKRKQQINMKEKRKKQHL